MAYFHSRTVKIIGGRRRKRTMRVVGETLEEMRRVARRWPDHVSINWPRRNARDIRSKSAIRMFVDAEREDILQELQSVPVSENHVKLLTCLLRKQFFESFLDLREEDRRWLDAQIRGTLHQLLRMGDWIDEPENLSLKNLNSRLEKFDLGRRSDLKFSSTQSLDQIKYDQDLRRAKEAEQDNSSDDPEFIYRNGSREERENLLQQKPWLRKPFIEQFGEP